MSEILKTMRKTRIVCVSDTHNACNGGGFKLPKGDVLIHAGDLTNQGSFKELEKAVKWIEEADFEAKIVVAGNHDISLDSPFYDQYGLYFHNQDPQSTDKCQKLFTMTSSITYLKHEAVVIKLTSPTGPMTAFKIFGSPYSPAKGMWAFGYTPEEAAQIWETIPLDSDITVTHTPPKYHCDERSDRRAVGCEELRSVLWRVRPKLALCGHVHEGRGAEVIKWDLDSSNIKYREAGVVRWVDPGKDTNKLSFIDLSVGGRNALDNDDHVAGDTCSRQEHLLSSVSIAETTQSGNSRWSTTSSSQYESHPVSSRITGSWPGLIPHSISTTLSVPAEPLKFGIRGQGGLPPSGRCDIEALSSRLGRKETCVINAAIMASSWPHKQAGGKRFNKPIVVDIDLPVAN